MMIKQWFKDRLTALKSFGNYIKDCLSAFPVDGIISVLGAIGFIAWLCGVEECFLAVGFLLYGVYTATRLNDCIKE